MASSLALGAPNAGAQADPARDKVAAEALFREGRKAMRGESYDEACPKFAESYRLDPAAGTLLNLATCEEKRGRIASAWQRYNELREKVKKWDRRRGLADRKIKQLEARLPRLTLVLESGAPPSSVVERDGVVLAAASLGVAIPLDPGPHTIVVRAEGYEDATTEFTIEEGEQRELNLKPGPKIPPPPKPEPPKPKPKPKAAPPPQPEPESDGRQTLGYVIGGVGVTSIVVSLVTGGMVISRANTVDEECDGDFCTQKGLDAESSGKTLSTVSTVAFAVGLVGVGVGGYLLLTGSEKEAAPTAGSIYLHAGWKPGMGSVTAGGQF